MHVDRLNYKCMCTQMITKRNFFHRTTLEQPAFSLKTPESYTKYIVAVKHVLNVLNSEKLADIEQVKTHSHIPYIYFKMGCILVYWVHTDSDRGKRKVIFVAGKPSH